MARKARRSTQRQPARCRIFYLEMGVEQARDTLAALGAMVMNGASMRASELKFDGADAINEALSRAGIAGGCPSVTHPPRHAKSEGKTGSK